MGPQNFSSVSGHTYLLVLDRFDSIIKDSSKSTYFLQLSIHTRKIDTHVNGANDDQSSFCKHPTKERKYHIFF